PVFSPNGRTGAMSSTGARARGPVRLKAVIQAAARPKFVLDGLANLLWCRPTPGRWKQEDTEMASNGKVALVTGGGSGIGKASALALAREGFAVVVAGRRPEPLNAVVGEIEAMQGKALGVPTDVSDPASVEALFQK